VRDYRDDVDDEKNKLLQYRCVRPHRRCHIDRSIVFARWRECALPYNTWFLEPIIASTSPERYLDRFSLFCRDCLGRGRYAHNTHTHTHTHSINWAICKSAPRSRQITTSAPHHSVFTGRMPFLPPNKQRQSTEGKIHIRADG